MLFYRLLLFTAFTTAAFAQTFLGSLSGIASDASGAAVPGAIVKLDSPSTGLTRSADFVREMATFSSSDLPVGVYTLTVSSAGFETQKIDAVEIAVSKTTNINVSLGVARAAIDSRSEPHPPFPSTPLPVRSDGGGQYRPPCRICR